MASCANLGVKTIALPRKKKGESLEGEEEYDREKIRKRVLKAAAPRFYRKK